MKIKNPLLLIVSILASQMVGLLGSVFTVTSIESWYNNLQRPSFTPPNWVFGPVWTLLYTLIGVSFYLIITNKKKVSTRLFLFHIFLNAIWSPIFFGLKNLGLALVVILIMDITLLFIIKNFYKFNRLAAYLLLPYLTWISFATILNFSYWQLNKGQLNVYAEEFNFTKARQDYVFQSDSYRQSLSDFDLKKNSYDKNKTLSLKEELRLSLYNFIPSRNKLVSSYLTMLRMKVLESKGLTDDEKNRIFEKIDGQVAWYNNRVGNYSNTDTLEVLIEKSKDENVKYTNETTQIIKFTLSYLSLEQIITIKKEHRDLYQKLRTESESLVSLGRADQSLFKRWFDDIDKELGTLQKVEDETKGHIDLMFAREIYKQEDAYDDAISTVNTAITSLSKLNSYIKELEITLEDKR